MSDTAGKAINSQADEDDEPDDWDKRIFSTSCSAEQTILNDCYFKMKDWRLCKKEMEKFCECWKQRGNDKRTQFKEA